MAGAVARLIAGEVAWPAERETVRVATALGPGYRSGVTDAPFLDRMRLVFDTSRKRGDWKAIHAALSFRSSDKPPKESQSGRIVSSRWEEVQVHIKFDVWDFPEGLHWHVELRRNPREKPPEFVLRRSQRVGWLEGFNQWLAELSGELIPGTGSFEAVFKFPRSTHRDVFGLPRAPWPGMPTAPPNAKLTTVGLTIGKTKVTCSVDPESDVLSVRVSDKLKDPIEHAVARTLRRAVDVSHPYVQEANRAKGS